MKVEEARTEAVRREKHRVRRLPVVDEYGRIGGLLSMNDLAGESERRGSPGDPDPGSTVARCALRP
jgi:CBS-domain-containing membrane protein